MESTRLQVVLADDSPLGRHAMALAIRPSKRVSLAASCKDGQSAIEAALRHRADVVILDVRMPGMDGYEAARIIRSCIPGTAIIMTSVHDDREVRAACAVNGADAFVSKTRLARDFESVLDRALKAASKDSRYREHEIRSNHRFSGASVLASAGCLAVR